MDIKLVITDIDGVWTDGGMYYDQNGNEWKKFNTSDSAGVIFLNLLNIPTCIITGEDTEIVKRRAKKLKINHLYLGVKDKLNVTLKLCEKLGIKMSEIAFIGDDINDMKLLKEVGYSACPNNSPNYIKEFVDFVSPVNGGDGAYRSFVEHLLKKHDKFEEVLELYFKN